jgi:ferredoxin-type protein NapH
VKRAVGSESRESNGFWYANRFLILRRFSQFSILALFLLGPLFGLWIMRGNLSSSRILDTVPLTDPFVFTQIVLSGHVPQINAIIGVVLVVFFYMLVGGRVFCSWVCPVNMITDLAGWLRRKFSINTTGKLDSGFRRVLLVTVLLLPLVTGYVVWELVNPVSLMHRGIIFGMGYGWLMLLALFLFDLFIVRRGWCGHVCPMGAFYAQLGRKRALVIDAYQRDQCDDCADCYLVCPEPQVLKQPLKSNSDSTIVSSIDCTNCGRCIDVCEPEVFRFSRDPDTGQA